VFLERLAFEMDKRYEETKLQVLLSPALLVAKDQYQVLCTCSTFCSILNVCHTFSQLFSLMYFVEPLEVYVVRLVCLLAFASYTFCRITF